MDSEDNLKFIESHHAEAIGFQSELKDARGTQQKLTKIVEEVREIHSAYQSDSEQQEIASLRSKLSTSEAESGSSI